MLSYVLITPAKNEAAFIENTIKSVISQTCLPVKWIIVSDGSSDGTEDIVRRYAAKYNWIELERTPKRKQRNFAGKVYAFNMGLAKVKHLNSDVIGNLDADISFDREYFSFLLSKFSLDPKLGVAGTPFVEGNVQYDYRFSRKEHVSGACQLFRMECFNSIGGYTPLEAGGIDLVAVVTARMTGWKTETFTEKTCVHHRRMGTAKRGMLYSSFKSGYHDFLMGVHPIWQVFRSFYQMSRKPVIILGSAILIGYIWALLSRAHRQVSSEFVNFRRKEQILWLKEYLGKWLLIYSS